MWIWNRYDGHANLCEGFTSYRKHSHITFYRRHTDTLRYASAVCRCVTSSEYYDIENMRIYVSKQKNAAEVLSVRYNTQTALITLVSLGKHRKTAFSLLRDYSIPVYALLQTSRVTMYTSNWQCTESESDVKVHSHASHVLYNKTKGSATVSRTVDIDFCFGLRFRS